MGQSDQDTDDEDAPRKQIPKWAEGSVLRTSLLKQCYMPQDLDKIFSSFDMPDLSTMFATQRKRFFKRTSSAVWEPPLDHSTHQNCQNIELIGAYRCNLIFWLGL